ncbi:MAG TPA: Tm-1-like ATP-binding domain-containing protein, partial [Chloroflexota bacterium]
EKYRDRNLYKWNPNVTLMRTTPEENAQLGRLIAEKLNASTGPVALLLPLKGLSQLDSEGNPYWWPEADRALFDALKANLRQDIPVREIDANINDPVFADTAVEVLLGLMKR